MKKNKKNLETTQNPNLNPEEEAFHDDEDMVAFVPGSSIIDIGELRRSQNEDSHEDLEMEEEEANLELSLDEEAQLLREEIDNDPEMQKDVLSEFTLEASNEELTKIAASLSEQEKEQMKEFEALAGEVSETIAKELVAMNHNMVEEDKYLETTFANEMAEEMIEEEEMSEEAQELKAALPQKDEEGNYPLEDLQSCIAALLFYSDRPVSLKKLKDMLEMTETEDEFFLEAIAGLKAQFTSPVHGFEIADIAGGYQLRTKPTKAPLLRKLAKIQVQRLSRGAMESLTIVAYKQPCTKDDIDQVRGVDSSHFIRTLLDRKLIEVSGRSEAAGRPMIYATTDLFLEVFGLMDLKAMPPLHEIEAMVPQMVASVEGGEDPRVVQMRKMVNQMSVESNHLEYSSKEDEAILQDIRERVKAIDISTPYLERQKALAAEGITGADAEEILTREFKLKHATSGGEEILNLSEESSLTIQAELTSESDLTLSENEKSEEENIENTDVSNLDLTAEQKAREALLKLDDTFNE